MRAIMSTTIAMYAGLVLAPASLAGQRDGPRADAEIVTGGSGEVTLTPQRAVLKIGVTTRPATAAEASSKNARAMNAVLDTLARAGFPRESLQTVAFGVGPNYDFESGNKLIDYEATATIRLKTRDLSRIGRIIDQALAAGATDVGSIGFESDSLEIARRRALAQALEMARGDAQAIAAAAQGSLGRMLEVNAREGFYPLAMEAMAFRGMAASGATPITPRDMTVRVAVTARWEFVPRR